ncbi:MAG: choice-of-anchor J domain-containing protein [Bacteroidales bacterium]|nr:choice-of-anchor J domain-containing protein [Bacteroidales bacterium]
MKRKLKNWFAVFLALIMGLGTLTAQNTVPLNEGFSNGLPDDWVINGSGSITSEGYFKVTYGCSGYLITQKVMPTESNHTLSFDLWVCQYCNDKETNSFDLMLSTTNAEVSSFTSVLHVDGADIACAQSEGNQTIDLSNYVGQEIYLAFYITDVGNGAGIAVDNISGVDVVVPACAKPTGLAVSNITSSSAQVSWTGTADSYQLKYAVTGEDDYTTTTVLGNTYPIPSLDANTNYTVEIKSICGSDLSAAATTTFKTECAVISVAETHYTTSFEDDETGSGSVPACWTRPGTSSYPYVYNYSYYARTGSKTLYWSYNTNPIALPEFVENVQGLQISFFARGGSSYGSGGGSMEVGVMTDPTDAETFTSLATITTAYSSYPEEAYVVRFNEYTGDGHYIAMRPTTSYSYYVDDVTVKEIPSCLEPTGLAVSNITSSSAQVSWTGDAESYQLSYAVTGEDDYTTTTVS